MTTDRPPRPPAPAGVAGDLRRRREDVGLTQKAFADLVGVTQQQVSDWERGRGLPHRTRIPDIAAALRLPPTEIGLALLGLTDHVDTPADTDDGLLATLAVVDPDAHRHVTALIRHLLLVPSAGGCDTAWADDL